MNNGMKFEAEMNEVLRFYDEAYSLAHIHRYSMKPVIKSESVAEHSYFVALGVVVLNGVYYFDLPLAMLMAICHDVPEMEISDVNHVVKKNYPAFADAIKLVEGEIIETLPSTIQQGARLYTEDSIEATIVHLADAMQCAQCAQSEMRLGNSGYMKDVHVNSTARVHTLHEKLQGCRKWK